MKNNQHTSLTFDLLVAGVIIAIIYLVHMLIKQYMPHILPYAFWAMLVIGMIGCVIYLHWLRMKIPGKPMHDFTSSLVIITVLLIAFSILGDFDKNSEWFYLMLFLIVPMWSAHAVFKQQQKRIEELEDELKQHKLDKN